jgi:hypothetical protein
MNPTHCASCGHVAGYIKLRIGTDGAAYCYACWGSWNTHMTDHKATYEHKAGDLGCDFCHRTNATVTILQSGRSYRCMDVDDCNMVRRQGMRAKNASCSRCLSTASPLEKDYDTPGSAAYVCVDKFVCSKRRAPSTATVSPTDVLLNVCGALSALPDDDTRTRVLAATCILLGLKMHVDHVRTS